MRGASSGERRSKRQFTVGPFPPQSMEFVEAKSDGKIRIPSLRWTQRSTKKVHASPKQKRKVSKLLRSTSKTSCNSDPCFEEPDEMANNFADNKDVPVGAPSAKAAPFLKTSARSFSTASFKASFGSRKASVEPPKLKTRDDMAAYFESTHRTNSIRGHTFEKITHIETARRALFMETKTAGPLQILTSFAGTLLPHVLADPLFWFSFIVYVVFRVMAWVPQTKDFTLPLVDSRYIGTIGGFLSFFLTFFASQSYSRFLSQYDKIMKAKGGILNAAMLCKANVDYPVALRMVRWLNACHLLAYVGLSDVYGVENFFLPLCRLYGILTPKELERIASMRTDVGSVAYREILSWVTDENYKLARKKLITDAVGSVMWKEIATVRENLSTFFENEDQPIPFLYIHLLYMMALVYLPLFAYSVATSVADATHGQQHSGVELIGVIIIFLNNLFVLGMRDLGHILQDPFGDDLQDMCVIHFVTYTFQMSRRILLGEKLGETNYEEELEMESRRPLLGPGFVLTPKDRETKRTL